MNLIALMRHFTIRTRFVGAIAVVVSLLLMVGAVGMIGLTRTAALLDRFTDTTYHDTVALAALQAATGNIRRYEKDLALNHADVAARSSYRAKWNKALEDARAQAKLIASDQNDEGSQIAARLMPRLDEYANRTAPVWKQLDEGAFADAASVNRALGDAKQAANAVEVAVSELTAHLTREAEASDAERRVIHRHSVAWFVGALLLATLVVAPTTLANMMSICRPLEKAREQAERIAAGDLAQDIGDTSRDESGQMLRALGDMQAALRRLVGDVRLASENISTASAEIATGNADLSQRTEQTASSLQTAAGSLQQITSSVRQSAESASQANQLAASASAVAVRGGEAVGQVVATMAEIEASSRRIADIIGTIDGIAFQTNILSLNAAVEAARAGEQGRGFAVVAGEVRSLAQRSAEAAREIKALIGASVERVDAGTRLVRDAGATMNEIVDSVRRVTDVIGEITASTTEQSDAIVQVSGAVSQLDQMTQQNAALVEQSAAAAESLKEQAGRMVGVVATFRTGEPSAFATPRVTAPTRAAAVKAPPPGGASAIAPAPREPASTEPARQAQQAIARARSGPAPAAGPTESDWESF